MLFSVPKADDIICLLETSASGVMLGWASLINMRTSCSLTSLIFSLTQHPFSFYSFTNLVLC